MFRTSQKNIEKEMGAVQNAANDLAKRELDQDATLKAIDGMISRVEGLKRKVSSQTSPGAIELTSSLKCAGGNASVPYIQLSDMQESAGTPTLGVMRERFQHLATVEQAESSTSSDFTRWADVRLDRWLVDWCLRNGKEKTARMIASQKGIEVWPPLSYVSTWLLIALAAKC